jgi:predicted ATPase
LRSQLAGFDAPHELGLDLDPNRLLGRLAVIIGENGTGKTRFLDAAARALCGLRADFIAAGSPSVSRVIALSCNAFDEFLIPRTHIPDIYFYVGLRSRQGVINVSEAAAEIESRVCRRIRPQAERHELWVELMQVIGLDAIVELERDELRTVVGRLGAGFKFACYVLTRLVSVIEPRSFVLFDEPENHTHPRLLSMMMRALHRALERFESFALVATHSPLVVQEVPARQVHILRCFEGDHPHFSTPADETFGASLGDLLRKTFLIDYDERNFDVLVRELVERHGAAKVRAELGDEMALSARLLLDKLERPRTEEDES